MEKQVIYSRTLFTVIIPVENHDLWHGKRYTKTGGQE